MADKEKAIREHQAEIARSGYRLPDSFYTAGATAPSAEEKSGDGGQKAADVKQESETGYQGELRTAEEVQEAADAARTVDPETGLTKPQAVEEQAQKAGATPTENKAASKKGK